MKLAEIQHQLQQAIVDGQAPVPAFLAGNGARGLTVYRNAYRLRLLEALAADYPKLSQWLGEEAFAELALGYVAAFPSRERSLRWVGKHLPEFLQSANPWRARPELFEMARFEWTLGLAFDCAEADPLTPQTLAQSSPEDWPSLSFKLHPSVHLLTLTYPVPQVWKALEAKVPLPECLRLTEPVSWLIWRQNLRVFFRSLAAPEGFALEAIQTGQTLAEVCEGLLEWEQVGDVARYVAELLKQWLEDGLIVAVDNTACRA